MTLRDGKFYNSDGQVVPLEFGNKEQIEILTRAKLMMDDGEELHLNFDIGACEYGFFQFDCFCGKTIMINNRPNLDKVGKFKCKACKTKYKVEDGDEIGLIVKLRK